jgi:hypothetical protein
MDLLEEPVCKNPQIPSPRVGAACYNTRQWAYSLGPDVIRTKVAFTLFGIAKILYQLSFVPTM